MDKAQMKRAGATQLEIPEHVHKFMRVRLGIHKPKAERYQVFKCMKPGCPTYIRVELVIGNFCECWRCGAVMVMNQWHATFKKPHCRNCTRAYKESQAGLPPSHVVPPPNEPNEVKEDPAA